MLERAISVTVSLRQSELSRLDEFAHDKHMTRSSAVRELMHRAGIIQIDDGEHEPEPGPCEHPRDSIVMERIERTTGTKEGWRCEDCGMVSFDIGKEWTEP